MICIYNLYRELMGNNGLNNTEVHNILNDTSSQNLILFYEKIQGKFPDIESRLLTRFTPCKVMQYILNNSKTMKKYIYNLKPNITLEYYAKTKPTKSIIERIKLRVLYLQPIHWNKVLNIVIYPSTLKKQFPINYNYLGPNEINSGLSTIYKYTDKREIVIYRSEELLKVLVHELIHAYEFDNKSYENKSFNRCLDIPMEHTLNLNESFTEFYSVIYTIFFELLETNKRKPTMAQVGKRIRAEVSYGALKVAQILHFFGYTKFEEFYNPSGITGITGITGINRFQFQFKEKTSIISYFIVKLFILANYKENLNKPFHDIFSNPIKLFSNDKLKKQINKYLRDGTFRDKSLRMTSIKK